MAKCPFCEYTGSSSSVEAHISGMSDDDHQGHVGRNWRSAIEASISEEDVADVPTPEATATGSGEPVDQVGIPPGLAILAASVGLAVVVLVAASDGPSSSSPDREDQEVPV